MIANILVSIADAAPVIVLVLFALVILIGVAAALYSAGQDSIDDD